MRSSLAFCLALAAAAPAFAQAATQPDPTGTVTGHVYCGDTNQPARFARVSLVAMPDAAKAAADKLSENPARPGVSGMPNSNGPVSSLSSSMETTLDGSYTVRNVKPGRYYVVVEKEGYINPRAMFTSKEMNDTSDAMRAVVEAALPHTKVDPNGTERVDVRLERGAAITGQVVYDDGSPAGELRVRLLHKDPAGKWVALTATGRKYGMGISTDDRGTFRMSSLLPDDYMLEADLSLEEMRTATVDGGGGMIRQMNYSTSRSQLPFYGSGTPLQRDAKPLHLRAGEELTGQVITLPIAKLHKLSGRIAAGPDAHFVNAGGVALLTRDDKKQLASAKIDREDGLFHFDFVPEGDYILRVTGARDVVWDPPPPAPRNVNYSSPGYMPNPFEGQDVERTIQTYGSTEQTMLISGDQLGITITVPRDAKPAPEDNNDDGARPSQRKAPVKPNASTSGVALN